MTQMTPVAMDQTLEHAGFWKRVLASLIDFALIATIGFLLGLAFGYNPITEFQETFRKAMENPSGPPPQAAGPPAAVTFISIVGSWLYKAVLESSKMQGTIGKMAVGISVTDLEGRRVDFGKATLRYALPWLGNLIALVPALALPSSLLLIVDSLVVAFTPKKQALHDMIAGCLVVNRSSVRDIRRKISARVSRHIPSPKSSIVHLACPPRTSRRYNEPMREISISSGEHDWPFSKGLIVESLLNASIQREPAIAIARRVEQRLLGRATPCGEPKHLENFGHRRGPCCPRPRGGRHTRGADVRV